MSSDMIMIYFLQYVMDTEIFITRAIAWLKLFVQMETSISIFIINIYSNHK